MHIMHFKKCMHVNKAVNASRDVYCCMLCLKCILTQNLFFMVKCFKYRHSFILANDARGLFGYSKLHVAASSGHANVLKSCLSNDSNISDVNSKTIDGGYTPLHLAASAGHVDCVEELLKYHQTDIYVTDMNGRTPLETAEESYKSTVAKVLRSYGMYTCIKSLIKTNRNYKK